MLIAFFSTSSAIDLSPRKCVKSVTTHKSQTTAKGGKDWLAFFAHTKLKENFLFSILDRSRATPNTGFD
jgi:hypothetical protein